MARLCEAKELLRLPQELLVWVCLRLWPAEVVTRRLGPWQGRIRRRGNPVAVARARSALARAFGVSEGSAECARLLDEHYAELGRLAVEASVTNHLTEAEIASQTRLLNPELALEMAEAGPGAVLLGSHYGSRIHPSLAFHAAGLPFFEIVHRPDPPRSWLWRRGLSRHLAALNLDPQRSSYVGESLDTVRRVRAGQIVGIAGDAPTRRGVEVTLLGSPYRLNPGFSRMHRLTGAPGLFMAPIREPDMRHRIAFEPVELVGDEQTDCAAYAQVLEAAIRSAPSGWRLWSMLGMWLEKVESGTLPGVEVERAV